MSSDAGSSSAPAAPAEVFPHRKSTSTRLEVGSTRLPLGHSLRLGGSGGAPAAQATSKLQLPATSALRSKLASFLPALAAANEELAARVAVEGAESVNVEAVDESAGRYIQMDVAIAPLPEDAEEAEDDECNEEQAEEGGGEGAGEAAATAGSGRTLSTHAIRKRPRIAEVGSQLGFGASSAAAASSSLSSSVSAAAIRHGGDDGTGSGTTAATSTTGGSAGTTAASGERSGGVAEDEAEELIGGRRGKWVTNPAVLAAQEGILLGQLLKAQGAAAEGGAEAEEAAQEESSDSDDSGDNDNDEEDAAYPSSGEPEQGDV